MFCTFLSGPEINDSQVDLKKNLMRDRIETPAKAGLYQTASKSAISVPVCAVPDYSIVKPPFTLCGSSANQTESITQVYTYSNKTTRTHTQDREGERRKVRVKTDKTEDITRWLLLFCFRCGHR